MLRPAEVSTNPSEVRLTSFARSRRSRAASRRPTVAWSTC